MRYRHRRTGKTRTAEPGSRHQRQLDAHRAWVLEDPPAPEPETAPETEPPAPETEPETEGYIEHAGGPWFRLVVDGREAEKVQGRDAAEARLAELTDG